MSALRSVGKKKKTGGMVSWYAKPRVRVVMPEELCLTSAHSAPFSHWCEFATEPCTSAAPLHQASVVDPVRKQFVSRMISLSVVTDFSSCSCPIGARENLVPPHQESHARSLARIPANREVLSTCSQRSVHSPVRWSSVSILACKLLCTYDLKSTFNFGVPLSAL